MKYMKQLINIKISRRNLEKFFPFLLIILVVVVLLVGSTIFFYNKYKKASKSQQPLTEIEQIVRNVSQLMEVPVGETPTLATVSDKTKLQNQDFFQFAENGDRILVYSQAKKAILYRPSINKIIDIAPVMPLADLITPTLTANIKIALYNGTKISGLTTLAEGKIKEDSELGSKVEITSKENAKKDYTKTLVVDLNANQPQIAEKLASILKGSVGTLPQGEAKPQADFLIILGQ